MPKQRRWYRVYCYENNIAVSERAYHCFTADQAVGYYVSQVIKKRAKKADYYAQEVDGPYGWCQSKPPTVKPVTTQTPPRQLNFDLSGDSPVDF